MRSHSGTIRLALAFAALLGSLTLVIWRQSRALDVLRSMDQMRSARVIAEAERSELVRKIQTLESRTRVVADARVVDLGSYFVGDRVRVWIDAGTRPGFVVPAGFVTTRFGLDYVLLRQPSGTVVDTPVQRGQVQESGLEILSGVTSGDVLVRP